MATRGFVFEDGDPSVGIFGGTWFHCESDIDPYLPPEGVIEQTLTVVRRDDWTVRSWYLVTCTDCAQQVIVYDDDMSPTEEAMAAEAADWDAWAASERG